MDDEAAGIDGHRGDAFSVARAIIRNRRRRDGLFGAALFADPAWDILLDLFTAEGLQQRISVSSSCLAAAVPPTTALRWINILTVEGLIFRENDPVDKRKVYLRLKPHIHDALKAWLLTFEQEMQRPGPERAALSHD